MDSLDHDPSDEGRTSDALDRLRAVWGRRKWLAIPVFALPFAALASLVLALPDVYRSTATVLVERQQVPEEFVRPTVTGELETRLHTISQEILSRSRLEGLITRFGLYAEAREHTPLAEVVERMRQDIQLELKATDSRGRSGTTVAFALSYRGRDPQTVANVTNTLTSFYIEENLKVRSRQAAGTAEFLRAQLAETKKRLDEQEQRVSEFRARNVGELPQQMQANLATLDTLNTQLRVNSDNQVRAAERAEAIKVQLAEAESLARAAPPPSEVTPPRPLAPPEPTAVRLTRLRQELAAARARYTERHPSVSRLEDEIAALEREAPAAPPEPPAPVAAPAPPPSPYVLRLRESLPVAEAERKILKSEEERLRQAIAVYRARVENTPRREQEFQELTRDDETTKGLYESLVKRHEEAQLAESMEQRQKGEQFRVLDPALPPVRPDAPHRARLIFMSLVLAGGLAAGMVLVAEMLDTSFHSVGDLRAATRLPVLVTIPRILPEAVRRRQAWRRGLAVAGLVVAIAVVAGSGYILGHQSEMLVHLLSRGRA